MLLFLISCAPTHRAPDHAPMGQVSADDVAQFREISTQLRRTFLDRDTSPPPNLTSTSPQT